MADLDPKLQRLIEAYPHLVVGYTKRGRPILEIAGGDNITVDNGSLADFGIASDTIGGVEYQFIKIVDGTLDSTTKATVDANGLWVRATIAAGQKIQLTDGTDDATISVAGARKPLDVHLIDSAGNVISTFGGAGGTSATDDAAFTAGTGVATPVAGFATSDLVDAGDVGALAMTTARFLKVDVAQSDLDVAHDAADSGNPVKTGAKGISSLPSAVAHNDRTDNVSDLFGRQLVSHVDPAMQVWKSATYTATQTGTTIWDPTAGKRIAVTHLQVNSYGTTSGRIILWFGDNADTTYTAGTDQPLFVGSHAPSSTAKPGALPPITYPIFCTTADRELHITTDAAISVDVLVYGYEW